MSRAAAARAERGPRVALVSPTGFGNLGDAAAIDAVIEHVRRRWPAATFVGVTLNPADTSTRHGCPAVPITGLSVPGYSASPDRSSGGRLLRRVQREWRHWRSSAAALRGVTDLVFVGGAQLDDFWGGPWGHPYAMAKWSFLGRRAGARVAVLGTGVGAIGSALTRVFVWITLHSSQVRTFRDQGSRSMVEGLGPRGPDPVHPDLAFGHPAGAVVRRGLEPGPRTIAIAPMGYRDPRGWPEPDPAAFERYLDRLARLGTMVLARGDRVLLVASGGTDHQVAVELGERIERAARPTPGALTVEATRQVGDYLAAARRSAVLVGSRLHGVILALLVGTPVVALGYERKVPVVMDQCGIDAQCLAIDDFEPEPTLEVVDRVLGDWERHHAAVVDVVSGFRAELDGWFDRLFPRGRP